MKKEVSKMGLLDWNDGQPPATEVVVTPVTVEGAQAPSLEQLGALPASPSLKFRRADFKKRTGMSPEAWLKAVKGGMASDSTTFAEAEALLTKQGRKAALYSSARTADGDGNDNWGTPDWLFNLLNQNFGPFSVDTCADAENSKVPGSFFDEAMDGLKQVWTGTCWCNPPYSGVADWIKKGYDSVYVDKTADRVVFLVANRTETEWFHEYAARGLVFFLRSRVKFIEPRGMKPLVDADGRVKKRSSPTFGSIVIVFDRNLGTDMFKQLPGGRTLMAVSVDWRAAQKDPK